MDQYLRLLRRQAQQDPQLQEAYIRALERAVGGNDGSAEISIWVTVHCHAETSSDDVKVFATVGLARRYVGNWMVEDIRVAYREGAILLDALNEAEWAFNQGNFGELSGLYDNLMYPEAWFEISEQEVHFSLPPPPPPPPP